MATATMSMSSLKVAAAPALRQCDGKGVVALPKLGLASTSGRSNRAVTMSAKQPSSTSEGESRDRAASAIASATAMALMASAVLPDVAEAAITPSLKNLLLSVAAGFGVLAALIIAVLGVASFDPIKRN